MVLSNRRVVIFNKVGSSYPIFPLRDSMIKYDQEWSKQELENPWYLEIIKVEEWIILFHVSCKWISYIMWWVSGWLIMSITTCGCADTNLDIPFFKALMYDQWCFLGEEDYNLLQLLHFFPHDGCCVIYNFYKLDS